MSQQEEILEKLRKIEALFAGAATQGERDAAEAARQRIRAKLKSLQAVEQPIELRFSIHNPWSRNLLLALLRRYGIEPYRKHGQKRTTIMANIPKTFAEETLIPEFNSLNEVLVSHLSELADKIISEAIFNKDGKR
jgi:hypothetical protein